MPDDYWNKPRSQAPLAAGASLSKSTISQEPSFIRRRKNEARTSVGTFTIGDNENENHREVCVFVCVCVCVCVRACVCVK